MIALIAVYRFRRIPAAAPQAQSASRRAFAKDTLGH